LPMPHIHKPRDEQSDMMSKPTSAWDSSIVPCKPCQTQGCKYRALTTSPYCCQQCEGVERTQGGAVPAPAGTIPQQDIECSNGCKSVSSEARASGVGHDPGCPRLEKKDLEACWWETLHCDAAHSENAACFVAPPLAAGSAPAVGEEASNSVPAPVILFLSGNGHIDDRQDFFWGGVDLLLLNPVFREQYFVLAPKPTSKSGLLRYNDNWRYSWAEDAVWALFTEVLRRLGPDKVDPGRLYVTGLSLGASGTWHLMLRYGEHLAAAAPISGACEWPAGTWPRGATAPDTQVFERLAGIGLRAYQIDIDFRAGNPFNDMRWLCHGCEERHHEHTFQGMDPGKTCDVKVHEWIWRERGTRWEFWAATGPLQDWSAWDDWHGDSHCLWHRVYPSLEWGLHQFLALFSLPAERRWRFDSPPLHIDTNPAREQTSAESAAAVAASETAPAAAAASKK